MIVQWFLSKTVRQASAMRKHVQKLLDHQRDILPPKNLAQLQSSLDDLQQATLAKAGPGELEKQMQKLEEAANKWLKPYPAPAWRENVEVLLVALSVAVGTRKK